MSFSLVAMWRSMGLPAKIVGAFLITVGLAVPLIAAGRPIGGAYQAGAN